jgi:hypothetical protein
MDHLFDPLFEKEGQGEIFRPFECDVEKSPSFPLCKGGSKSNSANRILSAFNKNQRELGGAVGMVSSSRHFVQTSSFALIR